jgi:hypothetical protein
MVIIVIEYTAFLQPTPGDRLINSADDRDTRRGGRDGGEVWAENGNILMYSYSVRVVEQCILHARAI